MRSNAWHTPCMEVSSVSKTAFPPVNKLILATLLLGAALSAHADYPTKPIRAVVAFGTGGATDVIARIVAKSLGESLGQPVIIDNKPGADGIIAGSNVTKSAADGYTVFFATATQASALPALRKNVPFDPLTDLAPIGGIGTYSYFWVVNPALPVRSLKDLAAYGRANPGKLSAGSSSAIATMAPTLLAKAGKFDLTVVPYKSETTAMTDLLGGRLDAMLITGTLVPQVTSGKVRGLATLLPQRSGVLPELPTMTEAGMPTFPATSYLGLFGPAGMPKEVVDRLSRDLAATLAKPEVRQQIQAQAMEVTPMSAEQLGALARREAPVWVELVKDAGIATE